IANEPAYPKPLRMGALNELYQLVFNNSFWEGGLVNNEVKSTGPKRIGTLFPGERLYANIDGGGGGAPNLQTDVDMFGYDAYQRLFPSLDLAINRARAEQVMYFAEGDPYKNITDITLYSPFITWDTLVAVDGNHELEPAAKITGRGYRDNLGKTIYRNYSYYRRTGDEEFLRWVYPTMEKQLKAIQKWDIRAGDHLPTDSILFSSGYDAIPPNGHGIYNSGLYLLALAVMKDAARRLDRPQAEIDAYEEEFRLAREQFESVFWVPGPVGGYYRFTDGISPMNGALFLDSFYGQHLAERLGLPDLVDPNRYREHLKLAYGKFMVYRDHAGRLLGAPNIAYLGQAIGIYPIPRDLNPFYSNACHQTEACRSLPVWEADAVWTGSNFVAAGTYIQSGRRFDDEELIRMGLEMGTAVATQIWEVDANGFQFNAPGWWPPTDTSHSTFAAYKWALGIWDTLESIKPLDIPDPE
ncbi:MAG TPA: GH116 family glycosyl hydrolase, partial [Nevskiales bacterium]|nr:GH116 family glycosyl hydrolase [Nevskiales bacterium]